MQLARVLILAPHTDDAELGCGGTIARLLEEGAHISIAVFSTAEDSRPPDTPEGLLRDEFIEAMRIMGVPEKQLFIYDYPVRRLSYYRQEVLEELVRLRRTVAPTAVLLPASSDLHQDHQVVHIEGLRAFKDLTLWGYELPWNHVNFSAEAFVCLQERHLMRKWEALCAYKSQFQLQRPYFEREFILSLARVRGVQVRAEYAEAYEVLRVRL